MASQSDALRAAVRRSVVARTPVDQRERDSIARFVEAFDDLEQPFGEHASTTHVTASAIVVGELGVVLHRHKRLNIWLQPGGHIDADETPWDAAAREALEETGLPVATSEPADRLIHVDVHPGPRGHTHLDLRYRLQTRSAQPAPPEGESQDVRWFSWAEAISIADPGLEGILRAIQPGEPIIRRATIADAPRCARVYVRSKSYALPEVPEPHTESDVAEWMAGEAIATMDIWVADVDGVIVGQMMLAPGWLHHLYVDPAWMGRGVGDRFVGVARQRHPDEMQLWAFQSNLGARRFYERHGFRAVEFTDGSGNAERWPDVRYVSG
jgi:8-oxo-dGTP pyrophosphatase MutT (NUDIX family)/GNAT superfamily N-acetyltransferase